MADANLIAAHLDHRRSYDDFYYVYPVISRRSQGVSIGINLNPDKVCNFDCAYCEVDRTTPARRKDVDIDVLRGELRDMLRIYQDGTLFQREPFASAPESWRRLNDIAFSGDGEPTTCPVFEQAVEVACDVREEIGARPRQNLCSSLMPRASTAPAFSAASAGCRRRVRMKFGRSSTRARKLIIKGVVNRTRIPLLAHFEKHH